MRVREWLRRWGSKTLLLAIAISSPLTVVEVYLRSSGRHVPPPATIAPASPDVYRAYEWGYGLHPAATLRRKSDEGVSAYVSNAHGFRGSRDFDEDDERRRVLVAGDSFVFGWGVEEAERFTELIEARRPTWRLDNLGMNGFGVDLMVRAIEEVGVLANPEVVVLCIYTDDWTRVQPHFAGLGFRIPRFELRGERLVSVGYPERRLWDDLHLTQFVRGRLRRLRREDDRLNEALLRRFFAWCRARTIVPAVVFFGGFWPENRQDRERARIVESLCRSEDVGFREISEPIRSLGRSKGFNGIHWSAAGHAAAGIAIEPFLEVLLGAR